MNLLVKKRAFTLAEVLITLSIIGVVAALTIPILINAAFEQEAVSKLKKNYAVLYQALTMQYNDEGCSDDPNKCITSYSWRDCEHSFAGAEKYLKTADVKYNTGGPSKSWMPSGTTYGLDGDLKAPLGYYNGGADGAYYSYCYYQLNDGSVLTVFDQGNQGSFVDFVLDINGNKKPNRVGKDIFHFFSGDGGWGGVNQLPAQKKVLYPYFGSPYGDVPTDVCIATREVCNPDDGRSPAAYVLKNNKLPDLKALGYSTNP